MSSISGCSGGGWTLVMKIDGRLVRMRESKCFKLKIYLDHIVISILGKNLWFAQTLDLGRGLKYGEA